ncbi:response regulator receiver sensor signal transduction histidine kinase [Melioribacter roseus P3M-2]|uniref:histidine kinase n=1 Tax=Melioribacter roseus (strain DSM 23840 / JCM 17771 / VKM B-2668 / P3M-2) TaxID=1191523 RepID=I6Z8K3_MELRP|nr:PAS domain-containing sensor histidine kinase [Melioribacter roseus]AFN75485.1 response regulator receiver sensor signal transduction histidine kinase [Melioribacter roseus P3M-2]
MNHKIANSEHWTQIDPYELLDVLIDTDDMFCLLDQDFKILRCNNKFKSYMVLYGRAGYDEGCNFLEIFPLDDRLYWEKVLNKALTVKSFTETYTSEKLKGRYFEIHFHRMKLDDNKSGIVLRARDITEKKNIEDKIIQSELFAQSILSTSPDAIVTTELDGSISYASNKFLSLLGIEKVEDTFSKNIVDFIYEQDKELFRENISVAAAGSSIKSYLFRLKDINGNPVYAESNIGVILNENKKPVLILFIIRDIQDRIEAELEREKLLQDIAYSRDQIEQEAARYVELNVQLAESEKKLIELNSAKDKLFSIIGHDLKNPIFTILGFSQILEEDYEEMTDEKKLEYIKTIYQTAASIQKLLENLLTWSRAQTGRLEVNLEPISIRNVINETVDIVATQAEKKNIEIIVNLNSTLMVYADNNLLETVVRNLLTNAIKFTNPGGRITVSTRDENGFVVVSVEDTGIGLSEADKNKLFRIDVNNAEIGHHKEKGTGLGLILCKEFCEKMGGSIWVESTLGKGSAFYFTVPIFQYINK